MAWYKKAKADHSGEIRSLELQVKALEDRKLFLPKQIAALKQEMDSITAQVTALKSQIRTIKDL